MISETPVVLAIYFELKYLGMLVISTKNCIDIIVTL